MVSLGSSSGCSGDSSGSDSPRTEADTYAYLSELIQTLGRNYRSNSFNESDSFLPKVEIPGINVPLKSYEGSSRDILYGGMSEDAEDDSEVPAVGNPDLGEKLRTSKFKVTANRGGEASGSKPTVEIASTSEESTGEETSSEEERPAEEDTSEQTPTVEAPIEAQNPTTKKSKAKEKPEKLDEDAIPPPPKGLGPMPYSRFYGLGPGGFTKAFRRKYKIPDDVSVERYTEHRLTYGEDFILLPLFAITEGGVRFPFHPLIRQFLNCYKLVPCQVAVNVYRILCSAMELAHRNNLQRITLGDLMLMYQVGKNATHQRYFMSTLPWFDQLVTRLYDSEKWANVFVKVSGNFEWGPLEERFDTEGVQRTGEEATRPYKIPRFKSTEVGKCPLLLSPVLSFVCFQTDVFPCFLFCRYFKIFFPAPADRLLHKAHRATRVCQPGRPTPSRLHPNIPPFFQAKE